MRALVIAPEAVKPVNHGARVDIWNRYLGLSQQGWSLMIAYWHEAGSVEEDLAPAFASTLPLVVQRGAGAKVRRALGMLSQPSLAALRNVSDVDFVDIAARVRAFAPAVIICEFVYCYALARRLADALHLPLIVRSHNIEHRYMATQFKLADHPRQKLQIMAARLHLESYETRALQSAQAVFDISKSDAEFWRGRGVDNVHWIPSFFPALEAAAGATIPWEARDYDCGYLGNLWAPNNVAALTWFLDDILPRLIARKPDISILVAGSNPRAELVQRLAAAPNVTLLQNPASASETRARMRVLFNPIREGSGLNTKSVEMLFADSPVVVTPFAIEGMDSGAATAFSVAADAANFADAMLAALQHPYHADKARIDTRRQYGSGGAAAMSSALVSEVERFRQKTGGAPTWR